MTGVWFKACAGLVAISCVAFAVAASMYVYQTVAYTSIHSFEYEGFIVQTRGEEIRTCRPGDLAGKYHLTFTCGKWSENKVTLNVNGKTVQVDGSFLDLSRQEQDAKVDGIAKTIKDPYAGLGKPWEKYQRK